MADKIDYSQLIPELPTWNNGRGITVDSWLGCVGNFELAIAFSHLFWPRFVEYDGCVLFADFNIANYQAFLLGRPDNRASVEWVMNHQHIQDLFSTGKKVTVDQILYLGRLLKEIFSVKLAHDFPQRQFIIEFNEGPFEDLVEYQITFWQSAKEPTAK